MLCRVLCRHKGTTREDGMMLKPNDPRTREIAAKGGRAAKGKLTLTRVQETLPPMNSPENVKLALETIRAWALAGLIPGSVLNGVVRLHEDWLKAHDSEMDRQLLRDAEERIQELEDQLRRASVRRVS